MSNETKDKVVFIEPDKRIIIDLAKYLDKRKLKLREKWNVAQDDLELDSRLDELLKVIEKLEILKEHYYL